MLSDIELDPDLKQSCDKDMNKYCVEEMNVALQFHRDGKDPHGVIYACLKKVHTAGKEVMSKTCDNHLKFVIEEENQDYRLDPRLMLACVDQITALCDTDHEDIVECLKSNFYKEKITNTKCVVEVARLLLEGKSDIMADPVLHEACAADLDEHCSEIPEGNGRKVNCLTRVLMKHKTQLTHGCRDELEIRKNMWAHAAKSDIKGVQDLSDLLISSENSSYLLSMITLMAMSILILGTLCGRCTKRVPKDRKMR